MKKINDI